MQIIYYHSYRLLHIVIYYARQTLIFVRLLVYLTFMLRIGSNNY